MSIENDGLETAAEAPVDLRDELASAFDGPETAAAAPGTTDTTAPATVSGEQIQSLQPPKHWSDADRNLFGKAPADIQKRWIDREGEIQKGLDAKFQEVAGFRREKEQLDQLLKPFERELGLTGANRMQFVQSLVSAHQYLTEKPIEAALWICQQYGIDPKALSADKSPPADPNTQALQTELGSLRSQVNGWFQTQQQHAHEQNLLKVSSFAEAKDASGKPLRPHFDEVATDIVRLMKAGETDLETAYSKAIRMNDAVWEKIQAEKTVSAQASKEAEAKARLDKAKRAAVGTDGAVTGSAKPKTLREDLEAAFSGLAN